LMSEVKLGTAMTSNTAATEMVTNSSIRVKPAGRTDLPGTSAGQRSHDRIAPSPGWSMLQARGRDRVGPPATDEWRDAGYEWLPPGRFLRDPTFSLTRSRNAALVTQAT